MTTTQHDAHRRTGTNHWSDDLTRVSVQIGVDLLPEPLSITRRRVLFDGGPPIRVHMHQSEVKPWLDLLTECTDGHQPGDPSSSWHRVHGDYAGVRIELLWIEYPS